MTTTGEDFWAAPLAPPRPAGEFGPPTWARSGTSSFSGTPDTAAGPAPREAGKLGLRVVISLLVLLLATAAAVLVNSPATASTDPLSVGELVELTAAADIATVRLSARACPGGTTGSGFIVDDLLFTSAHLVKFDHAVKVDRPGQPVLAAVLGTSQANDVAVVDGSMLVARPLQLSDRLAITGEPVLMAGHPAGGSLASSEGRVVGYQPASAWGVPGDRVLLLDPGIQEGYSGGPVLNRAGEVLGMIAGVDRTTGLTVAIPGDELGRIVAAAAGTWGGADAPVAHAPQPCGD